MFERFSPDARTVVVHTQEHARRLGHHHIGPEHLLLALVSLDQPASAALREHGVTPEGVEEEIVRLVGLGAGSHLFGTLNRDALASVGIDIDAVHARIEESFGPEAPRARRQRRPQGAPPVEARPASRSSRGPRPPLAPAARGPTPRPHGGGRRPHRPVPSRRRSLRRAHPVLLPRQGEPREHRPRGTGPARPSHRRRAPRPQPRHHDRRPRAFSPGGARRLGPGAAHRDHRPVPAGELTPAFPRSCGYGAVAVVRSGRAGPPGRR